MKYNYNNYTTAENNFIQHKLKPYDQVKTLGSHSSIKNNDGFISWRQLIFIGYSRKLKKSTYIIFQSNSKNKTLDFSLTNFLNPTLIDSFVSIYNHNKNDFLIESHQISCKINSF